MLKRFVLALGLVLAFSLPAGAEVKGVYGGLKFIDSIQNTGQMSKTVPDWSDDNFGIKQYGQNTVGGGIFLGYDFYPQHQVPLRVEVEYALRSNAETTWSAADHDVTDDIKFKMGIQTLFANAYLDFHNSSAFTPYVGAGAGMGFINNSFKGTATEGGVSDEHFSKNKMNTVFAWNVGVGCSYAFTENISADLAYRFVGLGYNEVSATSKYGDEKFKIGSTPYMNEFSLGLRFTF